mgnify:FL=1
MSEKKLNAMLDELAKMPPKDKYTTKVQEAKMIDLMAKINSLATSMSGKKKMNQGGLLSKKKYANPVTFVDNLKKK